MRIVMVADDVIIDRRILQEAETLITQGHEVILITLRGEGLPDHETIGRVKVERLGRPFAYEGRREELALRIIAGVRRRMNGFLDRLAGYAVRLIGKMRRIPLADKTRAERVIYYNPDCIHVHDLPQLRVGVLAKRALGVPLVYDAHELYPELVALTPAEKAMLAKLEMRLIKEADATITVNPLIAKEMKHRYQVPSVEVIQNAVGSRGTFDPLRRHNRFREKLSIPESSKIVLFQGMFALHRGLVQIIEGIKLASAQVHMVFMGYGDQNVWDAMKARARDLDIEDRVSFVEAVSQNELLYWTASADAGLIPYPPVDLNTYLCSPNKLYEFIQAGLPILANDLPYVRNVVEGEGIGLVRKLDLPRAIADAINEFFASDEKRAEYRQRILAIREKYGWEVEGEKLVKIYDRMIAA